MIRQAKIPILPLTVKVHQFIHTVREFMQEVNPQSGAYQMGHDIANGISPFIVGIGFILRAGSSIRTGYPL